MDQPGFFSKGPREGSIDLIPTVIVVTGQMESISQGLPVVDEPGKRDGKLLCCSDGPQAGAVLRYNDRFVPEYAVCGKVIFRNGRGKYDPTGVTGTGRFCASSTASLTSLPMVCSPMSAICPGGGSGLGVIT